MKPGRFCTRLVLRLSLFFVITLDWSKNGNVNGQESVNVNGQERFFGIVPSTDPIQNIAFVAAGAKAVGAGAAAVGALIKKEYLNSWWLNSGNFDVDI